MAVLVGRRQERARIALTTGLTEGAIYWHLKQIYKKLPISRQVDWCGWCWSIAEFG